MVECRVSSKRGVVLGMDGRRRFQFSPHQPTEHGEATGSGVFRTEPSDVRLGFVQVAFAGHNRTTDLGDKAVMAGELKAAFAMLAKAGVTEARLLTGLARGADILAARAWREAGMGPVHAVFSFLTDTPGRDATDLLEQGTWLDGAATRDSGRNPYLAQTRWLIGAADLLVVVWTGKHARGAGGTADAVRLALEHGVPVLWLQPGGTGPKLIRPERLEEDFGFLEFLEQLTFTGTPLVQQATPAALRHALADLDLVRKLEPLGAGGLSDPENLPMPRAYRLFLRVLGGRSIPQPPHPVPADLEAQEGFLRLTHAHSRADRQANELGAVHRSHQVILLMVAILAAVAGSASSLWPDVKITMVSVELVLAIVALMIWRDSERGLRHQRWGEARRLAEDLRLERAAWAIGVSTAPHGVHLTSTADARHERRMASLPTGRFDQERIDAWGKWAMDQLVAGQAAYHRQQSGINGRVSHRVHQLDIFSFFVLLTMLLGYLGAVAAMAIVGRDTPHWLSGIVFMTGAIVPAIGAAGLALEATLSLGEEAQRSRVLAERLDALANDAGPGRYPAVANAAIRLQRVQEDHWAEGVVRRRMVRGG